MPCKNRLWGHHWIHLPQDSDQRRDLESEYGTVMIFEFKKAGVFLTSWATKSFSGGTLLHGVISFDVNVSNIRGTSFLGTVFNKGMQRKEVPKSVWNLLIPTFYCLKNVMRLALLQQVQYLCCVWNNKWRSQKQTVVLPHYRRVPIRKHLKSRSAWCHTLKRSESTTEKRKATAYALEETKSCTSSRTVGFMSIQHGGL
jgi:hypothetical protein